MGSKFILLYILLQSITLINSIILRRNFHDGTLYSGFNVESNNVRYSLTKGVGWDNLDKLVESNNLTTKSMFCSRGSGIWLLYPDEAYGFGMQSRELTLIKGETCVPVDNINSIQPLGQLNFKIADANAVIGFKEKYFTSRGLPIEEGKESQASSLIFMGDGNWTVQGGDGPVCVMSVGKQICLVEDTEFAFSAPSVSVKEGCEEDMELYGLQSCYATTMNKFKYSFDFMLPQIQTACSGSYEESDDTKDKFLRVMNVFVERMSPEDNSALQFGGKLTDWEIDELRFYIIYKMFDVMRSCSSAKPEYLQIVEHIYRKMHLKGGEIWGSSNYSTNSTEYGELFENLEKVYDFLTACNQKMEEMNFPTFTVGCTPRDVSEMRTAEQKNAIEEFLNGEPFDFVIEQVWLIMNYANSYCNVLMGHVDNHWVEFPTIFKSQFLNPVKEQWLKPGKWATYYPLMFNGYDLNVERKQMVGCLEEVILETPMYDSLSRPVEFYEYLHPYAFKDALGKAGGKNKSDESKDDGQTRRKRQGHHGDLKPGLSSESQEVVRVVTSNEVDSNGTTGGGQVQKSTTTMTTSTPNAITNRTPPPTTVPENTDSTQSVSLPSSTPESITEVPETTTAAPTEAAKSKKKHKQKKSKRSKKYKKAKERRERRKKENKRLKKLLKSKDKAGPEEIPAQHVAPESQNE